MKFNNGFTLIEVLIAMVVLAIGLLGLAATQTTHLKNNLNAYQRSQATRLAYNMADRMRANVIEAKDVAGIYATAAISVTLAEGNSAQTTCKSTSGCSIALMAENDIYEWNNSVSNILPSGQSTITLVDPVYTISIDWDDDRDSGTTPLSFQMSFIL